MTTPASTNSFGSESVIASILTDIQSMLPDPMPAETPRPTKIEGEESSSYFSEQGPVDDDVTHQCADEIVALRTLQHCSKQIKGPDQQPRRKGPESQGAG
jgi:hypothetical protein